MLSTQLLAYIDPGTGSLVLQVVLASVLALGYAFRHAMLWPCRVLRRRDESDSRDHR